MLDAAYAHSRLRYVPDTGCLYWRNGPRRGRLVKTNDGHGYIIVTLRGLGRKKLHRIIWLMMTGKWPAGEIDHINRKRDDNRWSNLREASPLQQRRNMSMLAANKSGVTGVYWCELKNRWKAQVSVNNKNRSLGHYKRKADAVTARKLAEQKLGFSFGHGM